jgi:hypothetical protein
MSDEKGEKVIVDTVGGIGALPKDALDGLPVVSETDE